MKPLPTISSAFTAGIKYLYDIINDWMVYGAVENSYRLGGVGVAPKITDGDKLLFDDESSEIIEFGFKSTFTRR